MLTNVFRLGGLRQISWFQLVATDEDVTSPPDKWPDVHIANKVLNAHIRLQGEGHLSAWISDTSGWSHKASNAMLWLFIPGRNETINAAIQSSIIGLKVVDSGLWCYPKVSKEVSYALCEALRNRLERGLRSVGYMRFGEIFVKCKSFSTSEPQLRRPLPTCEVTFTVSEEAIFVHFVLQKKRVRSLCIDDIQMSLKLRHDKSMGELNARGVVVAPNGLSGKLIGCYSSQLIHVLYESKRKAMYEQLEESVDISSSYPYCISSSCGLHAEIKFGQSRHGYNRDLHSEKNMLVVSSEKKDSGDEKSDSHLSCTLFYSPDAVLVPLLPAVPSKIFLKRCWLQSCAGTSWVEDVHSGSKVNKHGLRYKISDDDLDSIHQSTDNLHGIRSPSNKSCSSNTSTSGGSSLDNSSSHGSSTSNSDGEAGEAPGELEADAESLASKGKQTNPSSRQMVEDIKGFEDIAVTKWVQSIGPAHNEVSALNPLKRSLSSGGEVSNDMARSHQNKPDTHVPGLVNVGIGTPKAASSQAGTPWDWPEDDRALNIENDADILAEFGDFGDFFEDEFGEPPGTAESQALMFPLTDCIDGINSPGNGCLDFTDPMLLPILDIPTLEGLERPLAPKDLKVLGVPSSTPELQECIKTPDVIPEYQSSMVDSLPKSEAMLLLAPGYEPVSLPNRPTHQQSIFKSVYVPDSKKLQPNGKGSDLYIYSATPPLSPKMQSLERKREHYDVLERATSAMKKMKSNDTLLNYFSEKSTPASKLTGLVEKSTFDKPTLLGSNIPVLDNTWSDSGTYYSERSSNKTRRRQFPTTMLATLIDCFLVQFSFLQIRNLVMANNKESHFDSVCTSDSSKLVSKGVLVNQQEKKKKDHIPSRIAGDVDEDIQDASRLSNVGVGVWRPVGTPKPPRMTSWNETPVSSSVDHAATINHDSPVNATSNLKLNHCQELLDALPLLIQQASVPFDAAFDGDCGAGPYGWLTCEEQERRKSVCGPGAIHAGCGGMLCTSHFLDNAGVELIDPLADEISAASAATMLQSDMRVAMATAFGDAYLDGPLSLGEWLRGRAFINESFGIDNAPSDSKDTVSTVIAGMGEPITPPQCTTGSSGMKSSIQDIDSQPTDSGTRRASSWAMEGSSLSDDGCNRRGAQEMGSVETDAQLNSCRNGPTIMAFPMPSLLVGYQDDWLKVSSSTLHLWEKAPFEPYATAKPVTYYVLCPRVDSLLSATADYLQQLGCVYETCRLGTHVAANMVFGHGSFPSTSGKHTFAGFVPVDFPSQVSLQHSKLSSICPSSNYASTFSKIWNCLDYLKAVSKACKTLPVSLGSSATQREPENGSCLVYYVICPSSDPDAVLQTMLVACQSIGHNVAISEKQKKLNISNQKQRSSVLADDSANLQSQGVVGFSTSKLVLQVLTAESILNLTNPGSVDINSLKEVAFSVYNKIRRIPRLSSNTEGTIVNNQSGRNRPSSLQASTAISGMWKDSGTGRNSGPTNALPGHESLLDSSAFRPSNWDSPWQQQVISNELSILDNSKFLQESLRYLFEPVFILAEPGSLDCGVGFSPSRPAGFDESSISIHPGSSEAVHGMVADSGFDDLKGGSLKVANLHCCYGWTENWQWLLSVWTDARGELLDVHLFPVSGGGGDNRFEVNGLHDLFVQVLLHGCQLMTMATTSGTAKLRAMVITRIGSFFELECQEWQKAVCTVGGNEVRKWPVQIWQQVDNSGMMGSNSSLQPQDVSTLSDRNMALTSGMPSSPGRSSSVFMSRNKPSTFTKNDMGSSILRKQALGQNDAPRGIFHLVHSISFVSIMLDHSLQMVGLNDTVPHSTSVLGGPQGVPSSSWLNSSSANVLGTLGSGIGSVKTLSSTAVSYLFVPAHGLRFMSNFPLQLPTCLTSESPAVEQLLHGSGSATMVGSAFVISKTIPSIRTELMLCKSSDEWPSTLFVGLYGHMSSVVAPLVQQHTGASSNVGTDPMLKAKLNKSMNSEGGSDHVSEAQSIVEVIAAELQALSWLTASPTYPFRRSALPFHCEVVQRLRRLLQYANAKVGGLQQFKEQV